MSFAFRDLTISLESHLCPTASAGCGEATAGVRVCPEPSVTGDGCGQATAGYLMCPPPSMTGDGCGENTAGFNLCPTLSLTGDCPTASAGLLACTCTIATMNGGGGRAKADLELLRAQLRRSC